MLIYGKPIKEGVDLKTRPTFADIAATVLDIFDTEGTEGTSFLNEVLK